MTVRVQFDITQVRLDQLEALMARCGIDNRKELFNNAFTLLEWVINERAQNRVIASLNEATQSYRELQMPIFSNIKNESAPAKVESRKNKRSEMRTVVEN